MGFRLQLPESAWAERCAVAQQTGHSQLRAGLVILDLVLPHNMAYLWHVMSMWGWLQARAAKCGHFQTTANSKTTANREVSFEAD